LFVVSMPSSLVVRRERDMSRLSPSARDSSNRAARANRPLLGLSPIPWTAESAEDGPPECCRWEGRRDIPSHPGVRPVVMVIARGMGVNEGDDMDLSKRTARALILGRMS
jgi:hypothetical protein